MPAKIAKAAVQPVSGVYCVWLSDQQRLSESLKGKEKSLEWLAKIAAANRGRKVSEETRAKMKLAQAKRQERERLARQEVLP